MTVCKQAVGLGCGTGNRRRALRALTAGGGAQLGELGPQEKPSAPSKEEQDPVSERNRGLFLGSKDLPSTPQAQLPFGFFFGGGGVPFSPPNNSTSHYLNVVYPFMPKSSLGYSVPLGGPI